MDRCATTPMLQTYILQGHGAIEAHWVQGCLHLFKRHQINLRKVVLLKNGNPDCFSMLEIHFLLPQESETLEDATGRDNAQTHPFLIQLQDTLAQQVWSDQSLRICPR
jgi:hypothetical protein